MAFYDTPETKFYVWSTRSIRLLMIFTMIATFEHVFTTLVSFSAGHYALGIPISALAKALLTFVIDFGLYLGEALIPQFKIRNMNTGLVKFIVVVFAVVSIGLNTKYMVEYSPERTLINYFIAVSIGVLIPTVLAVLGFIDGRIQVHRYGLDKPKSTNIRRTKNNTTIDPQLKEQVFELKKNGNSQTQIARQLNLSQPTISRILRSEG